MTDPHYRRNAGCFNILKYHLVWCSKYRRKVLTGKTTDAMHNLLRKKAEDLEVTIEALEIMPDHVHLFVSADPTDAPQRLANQFKGFTSRIHLQKYPELRPRLPSLWSLSYFIGSAGHVSEKQSRATSKIRRGHKR